MVNPASLPVEQLLDRGAGLLAFLDKVVSEDPAPPGFEGRVAVGVLHDATVTWWNGTFSQQRAQCSVMPHRPQPVDVTWVLGSAEAAAVFGTQQHLPAKPNACIEGNTEILTRFIERYVKATSPLDVRCRG